jgi:hypothetical protein
MNESSSENNGLILSELEKTLLRQIEVRESSIQAYEDINEMDQSELSGMNSYLEESYRSFLPQLDTDNLRSLYISFADVIKEADISMVSYIAEHMNDAVTDEYELRKKEIEKWENVIKILESQTIPRLKEEGLKDSIHLLEGAIMASEIKIANDFDIAK